jgi:hypothetical protein
MNLRLGMSGAAVKQVQQLLSGPKLYNGPIDSSFGGGMQAAVKSYQKQQGLPITGVVDEATWNKMFPGQASPVSDLASRPLQERCMALTGTFETGSYPPDSFAGLSGDFDGMGISFGVCQWNIGSSSLQPLLKEMFEQHTPVAQDIFHEHFDTIRTLGTVTVGDQLSFTRSIQTHGKVNEPWKGMLLTLGRTSEFQAVQANHASGMYKQALQFCSEFGLHSERAVALMFDLVTQNHSISDVVKKAILADFSQIPASDSAPEVAKMQIVANRRAAASRPEYIDDVRTRKLAIANGSGTVHGLLYDLEDMYGITLKSVDNL